MTAWHDIIRRCRSEDPKAQMEAYRLSWRMVFPAVFRVLRNREEAEDIMQEAYIKGFRRLRELREPEKYVGWQKQIAVRQALNRLRQLRPESVLPTDVLQLPEEEESWPLVDHDILRQAVAMLPDGYRISVELHIMEGMSHEEIGEALGIQSSTARSQYARAIQKLRQHLASHATS